MKKVLIVIFFAFSLTNCNNNGDLPFKKPPMDSVIRLHPENPHYFFYMGKPTVLITSAEHYGALINPDFDYRKYLETLAEEGMNYTRIFTGTYYEISGTSFGIQNNTLAPETGRVITPWISIVDPVSHVIKYNLSGWNQAYFDRLKDLMSTADSLDIIVEVTLFSSIYRNEHWDINPQNPRNNINIRHPVDRFEAHTLNNGLLLTHQESFVMKIVHELNEFDNFFYEIQNEPWADHPVPVYNIVNKEELKENDWTYKADFADQPSLDWQEHIASIIAREENKLPKKHLIAQNYTNFKAPIPKISKYISIINFHYAWPEAVEWNYHYNKVIGFDESGFAGSGDQVYRRQAWQFMLSGGGLFNNLDYSFYVGSEGGTGKNQAPGGGSSELRDQLRILSNFLNGFELENLYPDKTSIISSPGLIPYILSDQNNAYAIYLRAVGTDTTRLELKTGTGIFEISELNPISGEWTEKIELVANDGILVMDVVIPEGELGLRVVRK